jgi:hypothetical protein
MKPPENEEAGLRANGVTGDKSPRNDSGVRQSHVRANRKGGFVMMGNEAARDKRLSYRAKGILQTAVSLPPTCRLSAEKLQQWGTERRDAIRKALRELKGLGYCKELRERGVRGRWDTRLVFSKFAEFTGDGVTGDGQSVIGRPVTRAPKSAAAAHPEQGTKTKKKENGPGERAAPAPAPERKDNNNIPLEPDRWRELLQSLPHDDKLRSALEYRWGELMPPRVWLAIAEFTEGGR